MNGQLHNALYEILLEHISEDLPRETARLFGCELALNILADPRVKDLLDLREPIRVIGSEPTGPSYAWGLHPDGTVETGVIS